MKVGFIAEPNSKGQIVIPKKIRDELNITENTHLNLSIMGDGVWMHPVREVITGTKSTYSKKALLEALDKARGIFKDEDWKGYQKRRKFEIEAAKKARKVW